MICAPGSFRSDGNSSTTCSLCAAGTFSKTEGASVCALCNAGYWGNQTGASECVSCPRGRYQSQLGVTAQSECLLCSSGSFASLAGVSKCGVCEAGSFVQGEGSTKCLGCLAGRYGSTAGATSAAGCSACPIGKFANMSGKTQCALCTPGRVSPTTGKTACAACAAGKHRSELGGIECVSCLPGSYAGMAESSGCYPCKVGSFTNSSGATQCSTCAPGKAAPLQGQLVCEPFANYFGKATGTWDITYDDGSTTTVIVAENGATTAVNNSGSGNFISGRLQPATGKDAAAGWQYLLVDHTASDEEYVLKIEKETMTLAHSTVSQRSQGVGARRDSTVDEEASFPVVPVAGAAAALVVCVLFCLACAWKRHRHLNKAAPFDGIVVNLNTATPEAVGAPKLLGALGLSEDRSKSATSADVDLHFNCKDDRLQQVDEEAVASSAVPASDLGEQLQESRSAAPSIADIDNFFASI